MKSSSEDRVLIPIERELQERLAWFIRLRWLAVAGIFLGAFAAASIVQGQATLLPIYLTGFLVLAYNVAFHLYLARADRRTRLPRTSLVYLQIGLDWLALTFVVHYTGGIRSPVTLAFTLHIIIGAILLSRRSCYLLAASAASLTLVIYALEAFGIWPLSPSSVLLADGGRGIAAPFNLWAAVAMFFGVTAYLVTSITQRLREKEEALFRSEREVDRAYREMEALYQLGKVVNSTLEMKEVLELIAENAVRLLGMRASFIRLYDRSGERLHLGGAFGLSQEYLNKGPVELGKSVIDQETLAGNVVQVLEVGDDSRFQYREEARREGLRSVLCAPLSAKNHVLGVIRVYSGEPHRFSEQEQNLLKNLANLGALAIENAHTYAELKSLGEQRLWISRVTHHQLRAPLAAIQGVMDAIPFAGELNAKQKELLERASRRVRDAFDIIRDLLDLAAAQRPVDQASSNAVVLGRALRQALEVARERAHAKGVTLEVAIPAADAVVRAQDGDIERIFSNLLDNAVKYTPAGGKVRLGIVEEDGCVRAEVSDTGIGIDPRDHERIFEGFYRTQAARDTGEIGSGLGLSIVRKLAERWGARLELESALGKGTCFTLTFPCVKGEPAGPRQQLSRTAPSKIIFE